MRVAEIRQKKIDRLVEDIGRIQEQLHPMAIELQAVIDASPRGHCSKLPEEEEADCEALDGLEEAMIHLQHASDYLTGDAEDYDYEGYSW